MTNYYHADHLSARVITDSTGTVVGQRAHYPYGETWYETGTTTKIKFTSYERDSESGNDFAMARYHINRLGRFNSPDLLSGSISDPQSLNRYAYVRNSPPNLIDPLGLDGVMFIELPPQYYGDPTGIGLRLYGGSIGGRQTKSLNAPPVGIDDGGGGGGLLNTLIRFYCNEVAPSGRATSVSLYLGGIGSVGGSLDMVQNYNSGQVSLFATGGGQLGWNGGASLTVSTGFVYGLDNSNNGFSGAFKGGNLYVPTPVPGVSAGGSITHGGGVTVVSAGASGALAGKYGFGGSWTNTTNPLNVGNFTTFGPLDFLGYLARRPCN